MPALRSRFPILFALALLAACGATDPSVAPESLLWEWRYSGVGGDPLVASGILVTAADPDAEGWYPIESISGERAGAAITGLYPAGEGIPGNVDPETGVPYAGDNLIRPGDGAREPQFDVKGLQFSLADGSYSNVFYASFLDPPRYLDFHSVPPFPQGAVAPNSELPVIFRAEVKGPAPADR